MERLTEVNSKDHSRTMSNTSVATFVRERVGIKKDHDEAVDLLEDGLLDSLDFLKLISAIESEYSISIDFDEIDPNELTEFENLVTVCEGLAEEESEDVDINTQNDQKDAVNIIFIGNGRPMHHILSEINGKEGINFVALYTDEEESSSVVEQANKKGIDVRDTQEIVSSEDSEYFSQTPDYIFSINSTFIFPEELLSTPTVGCLNMHPGKLPEYAGMYAHQWALINGEEEFGATLHWMTPDIDAGPIAYQETFPITDDTGLELFLRTIDTGAELVSRALKQISNGESPPSKQQNTANRHLYTLDDLPGGEINWSLSSQDIFNFVRAADYRPFEPPTYEPYFQVDETTVYIQDVEMIDLDETMPRQIHTLDNTIAIGTKDGAIKIEGAVINGEKLSGSDLQKRFDFTEGERL
jgi:methionyl-tRNA formyltransferase/acyl carrier protein